MLSEEVSLMDETASLLEQCILYSDPKFTPFRPSTDSSELHPLTTSKLESVRKTKTPAVLQRDQSRGSGAVTNESAAKPRALLLTIDLDFELPMTEEQYVTRATTPLGKSTNRRSGTWKFSKSKCRHLLRSRSLPRSWKKSKQKPAVSRTAPQGSASIMSPTKAEFLLLPGEVRDMIYGHLFKGARVFINQTPAFRCASDLQLAIRSTCKTVYAETSKPLFDRLTITLSYSSLKSRDRKQIGEQIPNHVLDELRLLEIVVPEHGGHGAATVPLRHMPKLQKLKFTEVDTDIFSFVDTNWDTTKQAQKVISMIQTPEKNSQHWLSQLSAQEDRSFSLTYELEFWTVSLQDRAAHMGTLQKMSYHTILFTCAENWSDAQVTRLDLEQFQRRYEGYCRMNEDSVRISQGSHASKVLQKLENMRYHAQLDKMEFGIARHTNGCS